MVHNSTDVSVLKELTPLGDVGSEMSLSSHPASRKDTDSHKVLLQGDLAELWECRPGADQSR